MNDREYVEALLTKLHSIDPTVKLTCSVHDMVEVECKAEHVEALSKLLRKEMDNE